MKYAELGEEGLGPDDGKWLDEQIERKMSGLRNTVYNIQRSCAARLQRAWLADPGRIGDPELAALVGTEVGILHRLKTENPDKTFLPVSESLVCPNMKKTTLENLAESLREMKTRVVVPEGIAVRARRAIEAMLAIR